MAINGQRPDIGRPRVIPGILDLCAEMCTFCIEQGKPVRIWR
jgi:hypothetical protein